MRFLQIIFLTFLALNSASAKAKPVEPSSDFIEKAQNLILQKDRQQAIQVLIGGLRQERKGSVGYVELKKSIEELGSLFLSDKALQAYEMSLSYKRKEISSAQDKINEAMKFEGDNMLVLVENARLLMLRGDCRGAKESLAKNYVENKYDENLLLGLAQAEICLKSIDQYFSVRSHVDFKKSKLAMDWNWLELRRALIENNKGMAKEKLLVLKKEQPQNPQRYFYEWKISALEGKPDLDLVEKYRQACKNVTSQTFRDYFRDPHFCNEQVETENEIKKTQ